ncbi:hypothetical protein HYV81_00530 [Candidatus Woesearchaeota archaeon]|nr:hypothetical protein [Candidatus Woesearchaeota archaeon]
MMDEQFAAKLEQRGWNTEEIAHVSHILHDDDKKSNKVRFLDAVMYWAALMVAIFGNMIISIVLIPFLLALRDLLLYTIIVTLGVAFGVLFDLLIRDMDTLGRHHYIIAGLFIPSLAIINVVYMANFANSLTVSLALKNLHSPLLVGAVYTISFIMPYLFSHIMESRKPVARM